MRTLRASELGSFLYCERAWWYQRQGMPSINQAELKAGDTFHRSHSRGVKLAVLFKGIALFLFLLALALLLVEVF